MATIKEIKSELRHREWAEQIQECQTSGQTVTINVYHTWYPSNK